MKNWVSLGGKEVAQRFKSWLSWDWIGNLVVGRQRSYQLRQPCSPTWATRRINNKRLPSSLTRTGTCMLQIESMQNYKETCCYRNINFCGFDRRGCVAKERKEIESQIVHWTWDNLNFFIFSINQNVSKLQIILISFKKSKEGEKRKEKIIYSGKKYPEHCDTRTHDLIRRNFEKSNSRDINL